MIRRTWASSQPRATSSPLRGKGAGPEPKPGSAPAVGLEQVSQGDLCCALVWEKGGNHGDCFLGWLWGVQVPGTRSCLRVRVQTGIPLNLLQEKEVIANSFSLKQKGLEFLFV